MSKEAERAISAWLHMHPSVFAVILLKAPVTVKDWSKRACILYEACKFFRLPGMVSGEKSYSCQWLVRTFLVSFMRSENVNCLEVGIGSALSELNGPDQGGVMQKIAEQCRASTIDGLFAGVEYDGPPELFTMYLRLVGARGGVKRKHDSMAGSPNLVRRSLFVCRKTFPVTCCISS